MVSINEPVWHKSEVCVQTSKIVHRITEANVIAAHESDYVDDVSILLVVI